MTYRYALAAPLLVLALIVATACTATRPIRIQRPAGGPVARLSDVQLPAGTPVLVQLATGETVRGKARHFMPDVLEVQSTDPDAAGLERRIPTADIVLLAKIVGRSKSSRGRLGAAIGAAATLPFSISMFADMIVPGAIAGALIGRRTGDSTAQVLFERE